MSSLADPRDVLGLMIQAKARVFGLELGFFGGAKMLNCLFQHYPFFFDPACFRLESGQYRSMESMLAYFQVSVELLSCNSVNLLNVVREMVDVLSEIGSDADVLRGELLIISD